MTNTATRRQHLELLHNHLRCARCGQRMHPSRSTVSNPAHPQLAGHRCPQPHPTVPTNCLDTILAEVHRLITTHMIGNQGNPTPPSTTPSVEDLLPQVPVHLLQRLLSAYRLAIGYDHHQRRALLHIAIPATGSRRRYRTQRLTLGQPQFVELSETDRRNAVAALTDILIAWQQRHTSQPPAPPPPQS